MSTPIIPGQVLLHFKGGRYKVLHLAKDSETEETVVVYLALKDGGIWVRPAHMFTTSVEWPDGVTRNRFIIDG